MIQSSSESWGVVFFENIITLIYSLIFHLVATVVLLYREIHGPFLKALSGGNMDSAGRSNNNLTLAWSFGDSCHDICDVRGLLTWCLCLKKRWRLISQLRVNVYYPTKCNWQEALSMWVHQHTWETPADYISLFQLADLTILTHIFCEQCKQALFGILAFIFDRDLGGFQSLHAFYLFLLFKTTQHMS